MERKDADILRDALAQIRADQRIKHHDLSASCTDGEVTLTGYQPSQLTRKAAEEAVRAVSGVKEVHNCIHIAMPENARPATDAEIEAGVRNVLIWSPDIDADRVEISVRKGRVVLSGAVDSLWRRMRAEEFAYYISGATEVANRLEVQPPESRSDRAIERDVSEALSRKGLFDMVDVRSKCGDVTLTGSVPDIGAHRGAYISAANTIGVRSVDCQLTIRSLVPARRKGGARRENGRNERLRQRVLNELLWDSRFDAADIDVQINEESLAVLSGVADTPLARKAAEEAAARIPGIRGVENGIEVVYPGSDHSPMDDEVKERLRKVLEWNPDIDEEHISVAVEDGTATLSGTVEAYWKKLRAEELAFNVTGVYHVINRLAVAPAHGSEDHEIAAEIFAAFDRDSRINGDRISVSIENGHVLLVGCVPDWDTREAAGEAARHAPGVRDIRNELIVDTPPDEDDF